MKQTIKKTFISLRNRNFKLFFFGQTISNTGNWLTNVAVTLFALKLTGSGLAVGIMAACQFGPIFFLSAWAGSIVDHVDKRKALLITQTLEMLQSISLAVLAFLPHPSIIALYVISLIGGTILAFDNPLRRSFVSEMVRPEDLPNAVVVYSNTINISRIFGPALAGLLIVTLGYGWSFTIDAASYVAVIGSILMMRPQELFRKPARQRMKGAVAEGIKYIFSIPLLWISFVMLLIIGTLSYNFTVTIPLFVTDSLHQSGGVFTILYALFSCGAVICSFIVAHRSLVRMHHIIWGATSLGVTMILLAFMPGTISGAVMIFLLGMASILYMTSTTTIVQVEAKREMHGRVLALQTTLMMGTTIIGGPLCGWLADVAGGRAPLVFGGIFCLIAALFGFIMTKKYIHEHKVSEL